jgi:hypothetical protein
MPDTHTVTLHVPYALENDPAIRATLDCFEEEWPELDVTRKGTSDHAFRYTGPASIEGEDGDLHPAWHLGDALSSVLIDMEDTHSVHDRIRRLQDHG